MEHFLDCGLRNKNVRSDSRDSLHLNLTNINEFEIKQFIP